MTLEDSGSFGDGIGVLLDFAAAGLVPIGLLPRFFGGIEIFTNIVKGVEIYAITGAKRQRQEYRQN